MPVRLFACCCESFTPARAIGSVLLGLLMLGCADPKPDSPQPKPDKVIGETTQEIGEAKGGEQQADMRAEASLIPGKTALGAYGSAVSQISKQQIQRAVRMYRAETGEYPKTHDEFMNEVIKRYNIQLPKLPGGRQYKYDVDNHELVVVEADSD